MERRLNAELWDKMHYLFRDFNDRMVHVELRYDFEIDIEALKTVLICFFEKAPVLHGGAARAEQLAGRDRRHCGHVCG